MNILKLVLQLIPLLCSIKAAAAVAPPLAKHNCQAVCGNVSIPYPFGMGKQDCYHNRWYEISCDHSFNPHKPFLKRFNLEVLEVSFEGLYTSMQSVTGYGYRGMVAQSVTVNGVYGYRGMAAQSGGMAAQSVTVNGVYGFRGMVAQSVTVNGPVASNCKGDSFWNSAKFGESPFNFSAFNRFTVLGCENALLMSQQNREILAGCTSICKNINMKGCYGIDCCQAYIPYGLDMYSVNITGDPTANTAKNCTYAFLLDRTYLEHNSSSVSTLTSRVKQTEHAPVLLEWMMTNLPINRSSVSHCYTSNDETTGDIIGYSCFCEDTYEGNPYIPQGCQVVEACAHCKGYCHSAPKDEDKFVCDPPSFEAPSLEAPSLKGIILGVSISGGSSLLLLGSFGLYKVIKKMRKIKLKQKFFKRNGGLLLQQQMSSDEGTLERTKIFTSKELEKATDNFNKNRIIGEGGQGTVYKGMLSDGRIVAIKKSKLVDESQLEQFINEVVILSQINHRNVVNLFGCCLETNVPLLVYEFVSNGNLFELIHDQNEEFPLSWEMRLQIATEVAGAVAYLHSASSIPIYHRDIKSTNILLDDKYRAKVSDFGTSRSISIDQTHLTTLVHGTFGYLDPEYFQSSQFTEKSDVYSFGVVLAELLTGQKPISAIRSQEDKSLATYFISSLKENRLFDIINARVIKEGGRDEIVAVSNLAKRCLNLNGKKRPTMKEVTMELEGIRRSPMPLNSQQNFEEDECIVELTGPMDGVSISVSSCSDHTGASSSDVHPLLYN